MYVWIMSTALKRNIVIVEKLTFLHNMQIFIQHKYFCMLTCIYVSMYILMIKMPTFGSIMYVSTYMHVYLDGLKSML